MRIDSRVREIEQLFEKVNSGDPKDEQLRTQMAQYFCIRVSALVELALKEYLKANIAGAAPKHIQTFVISKTKNITNLKFNKLKTSLESFSPEWGQQLEENLTDEERDALDSLVNERNKIAHGNPTNITLRQVENYFNAVKSILSKLKVILTSTN